MPSRPWNSAARSVRGSRTRSSGSAKVADQVGRDELFFGHLPQDGRGVARLEFARADLDPVQARAVPNRRILRPRRPRRPGSRAVVRMRNPRPLRQPSRRSTRPDAVTMSVMRAPTSRFICRSDSAVCHSYERMRGLTALRGRGNAARMPDAWNIRAERTPHGIPPSDLALRRVGGLTVAAGALLAVAGSGAWFAVTSSCAPRRSPSRETRRSCGQAVRGPVTAYVQAVVIKRNAERGRVGARSPTSARRCAPSEGR